MSAAGLLARRHTRTGLRPVQLRHDLADIADLIETCFASTLDASGRSAIAEMRMLSRSGPLLWLLARLGRTLPFMQGFVWIEGGRLVGNVTLTPAGYGNGWVIANVAVAPQYRRQGIARQLMGAALDQIARRGAFATLQVDADNAAACALYASLGFRIERMFTRWRRPAHLRPPQGQPDSLPVRRAARADAGPLHALAARVRPNSRGGMGWLRPTRPQDLRPARLGELRDWLGAKRTEWWIVPGAGDDPQGALRLEYRASGLTTLFDLLVSPERQGELEAPLIRFALRQPSARHHPLLTEHPADDLAAADVLRDNHFKPERTLVHMIRRLP